MRKFLETLPDDRRIYYQIGSLFVQVTKKEALKLLKEASSSKAKKEV